MPRKKLNLEQCLAELLPFAKNNQENKQENFESKLIHLHSTVCQDGKGTKLKRLKGTRKEKKKDNLGFQIVTQKDNKGQSKRPYSEYN